MSIIQDALKRQQQEGGVDENTLPGIPAAEPPPPSNGGKSNGKKPWLSILIVLIILVAASVGAYILYQFGLIPYLNGEKAAEENVADTQNVAAPPPEQVQEQGPQSQTGKLISKVEETIDKANRRMSEDGLDDGGSEQGGRKNSAPAADPKVAGKVESDPNADEEKTPEVPTDPKQKEPEKVAEEDVDQSQPQQDPEPAPPTPKEPVIWPQINIKGIMAPGSGIRGAVLMDTSMFSEGDSYKGVRILKISKTSVLLEFEGEKRSLSTGQSVGN